MKHVDVSVDCYPEAIIPKVTIPIMRETPQKQPDDVVRRATQIECTNVLHVGMPNVEHSRIKVLC